MELSHVWRVLGLSLLAHVYDKVALLTQAGSSVPSILLAINVCGSGCQLLDSSLEDVTFSSPSYHHQEKAHLKVTRRKLTLSNDPGTGSAVGRQLSGRARA